ncbi:hypothetical protein GGR53DRAFT_526246, partial [Hypoxylon sp. FL1150]
ASYIQWEDWECLNPDLDVSTNNNTPRGVHEAGDTEMVGVGAGERTRPNDVFFHLRPVPAPTILHNALPHCPDTLRTLENLQELTFDCNHVGQWLGYGLAQHCKGLKTPTFTRDNTDIEAGYNVFGVMRSKKYWGEDADTFRAERWGTSRRRSRKEDLAETLLSATEVVAQC